MEEVHYLEMVSKAVNKSSFVLCRKTVFMFAKQLVINL